MDLVLSSFESKIIEARIFFSFRVRCENSSHRKYFHTLSIYLPSCFKWASVPSTRNHRCAPSLHILWEFSISFSLFVLSPQTSQVPISILNSFSWWWAAHLHTHSNPTEMWWWLSHLITYEHSRRSLVTLLLLS